MSPSANTPEPVANPALVSPPRALILLPVSDRVQGGTTVKQKARFVSLTHTQLPGGECEATIRVMVHLYAPDAAAADGYGQELTGNGFSPYGAELVANNESLVDAQTGELLAVRYQTPGEVWDALLQDTTRPVMYQGDFFMLVRENQPVTIGALIRDHIQKADLMGRFSS